MLDAHRTIFCFWVSRGPIFREPFISGTIFPGTISPGDHFSGTIFPRTIFPGFNDTQSSDSKNWLHIKCDIKFKFQFDLKFDFKLDLKSDLKFDLVTINSALGGLRIV